MKVTTYQSRTGTAPNTRKSFLILKKPKTMLTQIAISLIILLVSLSGSPAFTQELLEGTYLITNVHHSKSFLNANNKRNANDPSVILQQDGSNPNARWIIKKVPNVAARVTIMNASLGTFLEADTNAGANGSNVLLGNDNGAIPLNRQWVIREANRPGNGTYTIKDMRLGSFLHADKNGRADGANVNVVKSGGGESPNEHWRFTRILENALLDLKVSAHDKHHASSTHPSFPGYTKANIDLNRGVGGKFIYLWKKIGPPAKPSDAISRVYVLNGKGPNRGKTQGTETALDTDLNAGAGGDFLYLAFSRNPRLNPILDIDGKTDENLSTARKLISREWTLVNSDLNKGAGGHFVYLQVKSDPSLPFSLTKSPSDTPVKLFDTTHATIKDFDWKTTSEKDGDHGVNLTHTKSSPIPITLGKFGSAESDKFGTRVSLLAIETAPTLRGGRLILEDQEAQRKAKSQQAQGAAQQKVLFNHKNSIIEKRNGELILLLRDLTTFQNESYTKQDNFVGPFLESVKVSYERPARWGLPQISPLSQNKDGSYNQSTSINADLSAGFSGTVPGGSLSGGISQTEGSSTSLSDIAFTQVSNNSQPIFNWKMANYYEKPSKVQSYEDNPFRMVRKEAAQIPPSGNTTYHAPDLSQGSFQIATHNAYTIRVPGGNQAIAPDFKVKINYEVAYRVIFTKNRKHKSDLEAFGKGVGFVFGLNPDMWSAEAFKTWRTAKRTFKFSTIVEVPADVINQESPKPQDNSSGF